jgi:hypothetical protein
MALVKAFDKGVYTNKDLNAASIRDYFIIGKSTANIRIKGLWG